ncbi:hypothetical protein D3C75_1212990 [compost metagenome]
MGHLQGDVLAFLSLPVLLEGGVVVLVEVAHHVIGDVQQRCWRGVCQRAEGQAGGQKRGTEEFFHCAFLVRIGVKGIMPATIAAQA